MFWQILVSFVLIAALSGASVPCTYGQEPGSSGKKPPQVRFIQFKGVQAFSTSELKKILTTKEKRFLHWFTKAPLDEKKLAEDLERIEKYYRSRGFYDARVADHQVVPLVGNEVRIEIQVAEGPPMMVSEVNLQIDGESSGSWHHELAGLLPLKPGDRFSTPAYQDLEKVILRYLGDWGYPRASVDLRATLDKRTNNAVVSVSVTKGQICFVGLIRVEGNEGVTQDVILRELTFRTGDRFNSSKVQESQQKLFGLDLFQFVELTVENMEGDSTALPIRILVRESKKQTLRVGAGYGTEDSFRGQIQWQIRNFMGDGRRLEVTTKASSLVQYLQGKILQPYLLDSQSNLVVTGEVRREDQVSFENQKIALSPVANYRWSDKLTSYFGYDIEANRLLSVDLTVPVLATADHENQEFFVSSLIHGTSWDRVDDLLNPKRGIRLIENIEWATSWLGSEVDFIKLTLEGRGYLPVKEYGVLAAKLKWGEIHSLDNTRDRDIPIFERFFAGGSDSVRGYPYQRLGPLDRDGNPKGGLTLFEGSMEFRFPIRKPFEGVTFFDFGNVYGESFESPWDELRYTVGVGVRYLTIVGPLRFDIGYQLNPPEQDFFSPYQFHFSIGQAF